MTIGQALAEIGEIQPHSFGNERMIAWLRQLDTELYEKIIKTHEGAEGVAKPEYTAASPDGTVLLVPEPYDCIYLHWLQSRIDYAMAEFGRYNNSNAMCEADRQEFAAWYNRTHMPVQRTGGKYF